MLSYNLKLHTHMTDDDCSDILKTISGLRVTVYIVYKDIVSLKFMNIQ